MNPIPLTEAIRYKRRTGRMAALAPPQSEVTGHMTTEGILANIVSSTTIEGILTNIVSSAIWWVMGSCVPVIIYLANIRHTMTRDYAQVIGTYLTFHKRIGADSDSDLLTVNILNIKHSVFSKSASVIFLNGARFNDGKIDALYHYEGTITKGDPEYTLAMHCRQLNEDLLAVIPASNSSLQLSPMLLMARNFNSLPCAHIGVVIGQEYFLNNLNTKACKERIVAALRYVSKSSNGSLVIAVNKTQHDVLEFFHNTFGAPFIEAIDSDPGWIRKNKYSRDKFNEIGPYI